MTIRSSSWSGPAPACASSRLASARTASRSSGRRRFAAERSSRPKMLLERERLPVVDADHLEHAVAAEQPLVGGRDHRLGGEHDLAVERGRARWPGRGHPRRAYSCRHRRSRRRCPHLGEADDRRRRGGHVLDRGPLAHRVVLVAAGEDVRRRQPHLAQPRAVGAAADRRAGPARSPRPGSPPRRPRSPPAPRSR